MRYKDIAKIKRVVCELKNQKLVAGRKVRSLEKMLLKARYQMNITEGLRKSFLFSEPWFSSM